MNIYTLKRTDVIGWDEYEGFVVKADSEERALEIIKEETRRDFDFYKDKLKINLVGYTIDSEECILLESFNAG